MATLDLPEDLNVLSQPHSKMLEDHLARQGDELLRQHPYPRTLDEWEKQRASIRERLIESLGGLSEEKCDLSLRVPRVPPGMSVWQCSIDCGGKGSGAGQRRTLLVGAEDECSVPGTENQVWRPQN